MNDRPKWTLPDDIRGLLEPDGTEQLVRHIPQAARPPRPSRDALARDPRVVGETREFDAGNYEKRAQRNKHVRDQAAKGAVHWGSLCLLWLGIVMFGGLNVVWFLHVAVGMRFLPEQNLALIQNIIAAIWVGRLGMILERYANKHGGEE